MKRIFLITSLLLLLSSNISNAKSSNYFNRVVNAIYIIEGGSKTKYPYGIKAIETKGNKNYARQICYNTVRNNYYRWERSGKKEDFITFLGDRYCPKVSDEVGNKNWKQNIKLILGK